MSAGQKQAWLLHVIFSRLQGSADARRIHEGKHLVQAIVLLANQVAGGLVKVHDARRGAVDAHLLLNAAAGQVLLGLERTILLQQVLLSEKAC